MLARITRHVVVNMRTLVMGFSPRSIYLGRNLEAGHASSNGGVQKGNANETSQRLAKMVIIYGELQAIQSTLLAMDDL